MAITRVSLPLSVEEEALIRERLAALPEENKRFDNWVRVMADYGSSGLWGSDGIMLDVEELALSPALVARLTAWADWYERSEFYLSADERTREIDLSAFAAEGMAIAALLKVEHRDWTVVYHCSWRSDEAYAHDEKTPKGVYEFEVPNLF